ncbi:hypothetical protein MARINOS108_11582 [Marinoscillum sp. 108]|nr:hypothetical protein MARINOS108_11582 [Marinoscillum sp. 108]
MVGSARACADSPTIGSAGYGGSLLKILVMESFEGSNMLLSLPTIQLENGVALGVDRNRQGV